jgi:hypothetical protein
MDVFPRLAVLAKRRFSADPQPARFDADLDLFPGEPRNIGSCGKIFAGYREIKLHGAKYLGFREIPILLVVSMHVSATLENLEGATCNQVEDVLGVFAKFMNRYQIQISMV